VLLLLQSYAFFATMALLRNARNFAAKLAEMLSKIGGFAAKCNAIL